MSNAAVRVLAEEAGVATQWTDVFGREQHVEDGSLRAILHALELPCATTQQVEDSLSQLRAQSEGKRWPPLITGSAGEPVRLPGSLAAGARFHLQLEDGTGAVGELVHDRCGKVSLPAQFTVGYHTLKVGEQCCTLAIAPQRCFGVSDALVAQEASRGPTLPWGLAAQVYSLRREGDGGLADYRALESLARAAAQQGASALAISPLHAMFSAAPERFSPYAPSSRLFFNVMHIAPADVLGEAALAEVMAGLPGSAEALKGLEAPELVDWPQAAAWRLQILRDLFTRWQQSAESEHQAFKAFCERGGPDLMDHATFEAIDASLREQQTGGSGSDWRQWPQALHDPHGVAVFEFAREHRDSIDFHRFLQWQASRAREKVQREARAAGMAIGVIADLAVGAHPGGSQAWGLRRSMLGGLTVGAPPDLLAPQGQNWGLGALSPRALQLQGFAPWLSMLRANMAGSGGIRIDHVLGLRRLWLVPEGMPSSAGAYLQFPQQDLLRLTALESLRHRCIVIGEDLGTVPAGFSEELAEAGVLGIRALWFERDGVSFLPPRSWPASAMATTSTHDLSTVAGWWTGRDLQWRDSLGLLGPGGDLRKTQRQREAEKVALQSALQEASLDCDPNEAPLGEVLAFVGSTPAALVLAPLEDVLGIVEQPNLPGTVDTHPNWRQRLPQDASCMLDEAPVRKRLAELDAARRKASQEAIR